MSCHLAGDDLIALTLHSFTDQSSVLQTQNYREAELFMCKYRENLKTELFGILTTCRISPMTKSITIVKDILKVSVILGGRQGDWSELVTD